MGDFIIGLKLVFTMFSAALFPIIGLLACISSAFIEYFVFKEILSFPEIGLNSDSWAALLVFVLEGAKFTLHFYEAALKKENLQERISDINVRNRRRQISFVKYMLVGLSLMCSVIYMINIMYKDSDDKVQELLNQHSQKCDAIYDEEKEKLYRKKTEAIKQDPEEISYKKEIKFAKEETLNQLLDDLKETNSQRIRNDIQEEIDKTRAEIAALEEEINDLIKEKEKSAQAEYEIELQELEGKYGKYGTERNIDIEKEVLIQADNTYLKEFLLAFSRTFGSDIYSRQEYFVLTIFIGVIVSIVLEFCISISQMLLSIKLDELMLILGEFPRLQKGQKLANYLVWLMISVLLNTAVYLIASIIFNVNAKSDNIGLVLLSYVITIILVNLFIPKYLRGNEMEVQQEEGIGNAFEFSTSYLRKICIDSIVPASMAFVGYMLIGFVFNGNFVYGDMNGLAIAFKIENVI